MTSLSGKIGFIGGGNMAEAIAGAIIRTGVSSPPQVIASDVSPERLEYLRKTYGIAATAENSAVFLTCDVVVLAVKPQVISAVLEEIAGLICKKGGVATRKLIVSVAAGISIQKIEKLLYSGGNKTSAANLPIVRVMPNTPALVLAGMSGMSCNRYVTPDDKSIAMSILTATGKVLEFNEEDLNAVTAVSGSGPAYLFYLVEAMVEAGVFLGLSETDASALTLQTIKGALKLMEERQETPRELRRKVTSPGGTTEAAITVMNENRVKEHIIAALTAACRRARELCG